MTAPGAIPCNPHQPPTEAVFLRQVQACGHKTPRLIPAKLRGQRGQTDRTEDSCGFAAFWLAGTKRGHYGDKAGTLLLCERKSLIHIHTPTFQHHPAHPQACRLVAAPSRCGEPGQVAHAMSLHGQPVRLTVGAGLLAVTGGRLAASCNLAPCLAVACGRCRQFSHSHGHPRKWPRRAFPWCPFIRAAAVLLRLLAVAGGHLAAACKCAPCLAVACRPWRVRQLRHGKPNGSNTGAGSSPG